MADCGRDCRRGNVRRDGDQRSISTGVERWIDSEKVETRKLNKPPKATYSNDGI